MIKTEPIENSKSDRRLAEKELQITGKLAQLVGKGGRPASDERRDAANAMPKAVNRGRNAGTEGQNAIWRGQNASLCFSLSTTLFCAFQYLLGRTAIFRDEQPICSTVSGRTTASWDQRRFWASASNDRQPAEKELQITRKLPQLVGKGGQSASVTARNAVKMTRNAGKLARTAFIEKCNVATYIPTTGNERRIARKLWSNAKKFRRNAFAKWRDSANAMPKAVNRGRNAGTEGQNTIWRGRNTEIRDQLPIYSAVPGRTTVRRDEFSFCTLFFVKSSFFKALKLLANWLEVAQKGTPNRGAMLRAHEGLLKQAHFHNLLAAKFLCKLLRLLSPCYPTIPVYRNSFISIENKHNDKNFWRPVISRRTVFPLRPCHEGFGKARWYVTCVRRNAGKLWRNAKKFRRNALVQWRDATKGVPNSVNRGRNAGTEGRNTIWKGRNALNGERNAKKIWRNAKKFGRNASALTRGAIPSRDRFFGLLCKWVSRTLKPYTIYLITLKILFCVCLAHARQSSSPEAAHGVALSTDSIKPLKIGDSIPEALWNLPLQMVKAGQEGSTTVKLSDYKGKLIILDFWATWCAPCVAAFPKMDSLKKTFADDLALISVTTQEKKMVADFLGKMLEQTSLKGTSIVNDRILSSHFPYRLLPHYVWIDREGILRAMTGLDVLNAHQIDKLLSSNKAPTYVKEDVGRSYDYDIELKDQVSQQALLKNSTFAAYTKGFSRRNSIDKKNAKITLLNMSIAWFYRIAFSEFRPELLNPNRFIIEVKDSLKVTSGGAKGEALEKWSVDNAYCYELKMQPADTAKLFEQMRADIAAFFPYDTKIEQREMACLVLGKKSDRVSLETKGGQPILKHDAYSFRIQNLLWKNFTSLLDMYYLQNAGMPFVDETGITGKVDLRIKTRMTDYRELTKVLAKRGLLLKKEIRRVPVIVLRDREGGGHE